MSDNIDFKKRPALLKGFIDICTKWLKTVFLDKRDVLYLHMTDDQKQDVWPAIQDCVEEIIQIVFRKMDWTVDQRHVQIISAAAFLISFHTMFAFDHAPTLKTIPNESGNLVDARCLILSNFSGGAFTGAQLATTFYKVFELTDWKGCMATERHYAQTSNDPLWKNVAHPSLNETNTNRAMRVKYKRFDPAAKGGKRRVLKTRSKQLTKKRSTRKSHKGRKN